MRIALALIMLLVAPICCGCIWQINTGSQYFDDRLNDLTDVANISMCTFPMPSVGAAVQVGPAILGNFGTGRKRWTVVPITERVEFGLGGAREVGESTMVGLVWPYEWRGYSRSPTWYGRQVPPFGAVGFEVTAIPLILGVGMRFDMVELVDFMVGLTTIDILQDDKEHREAARRDRKARAIRLAEQYLAQQRFASRYEQHAQSTTVEETYIDVFFALREGDTGQNRSRVRVTDDGECSWRPTFQRVSD